MEPTKTIVTADMHTHSENSHDSVCTIEDMCLSQMEKGTTVFAVTDHCDVYSFEDYDIFTPIQHAYNTVQSLKEKYAGKCEILAGVEISEGIWHKEELEKIENLCDYDVILQSVHCVQYKDIRKAYSRVDFSLFSPEDMDGYLDAYFDDVFRVLHACDFDILAHLTCPLRYIKGKYHREVDLSRFDAKIETILKSMIQKGVALEVNTSSVALLNDFMPSAQILRKYHELGGTKITLGSDAHVAEKASFGFETAKKVLKEIGFEKLYYYKKRQPTEYAIEY